MNPESTDRITADTNVEVDRILYRDKFTMTVDAFDPTVYESVENSIDFVQTSSYFSITPYFAYLDSTGNRLYKGEYYSPIVPLRQSVFYNYIDTATVKLKGTIYETVAPDNGFELYVIIKTVNVKQ